MFFDIYVWLVSFFDRVIVIEPYSVHSTSNKN